MFTHQFFDLLLNLDDSWQVKSVDADYNLSEIKINIDYIGNQAKCPDTLENCMIYDHASNRTWRHLDTMQYKIYISCRLPRASINKQIKEVSKVATMFIDHLSGVVNALITNLTNAMVEQLNGKIVINF